MVPLKIQNIIKFPVVFLTIVTLVFGFFCVGMFDKTSNAMEETHGNTVVSIKAEHTCCGGTVSEHMQSWTDTFLTTPNNLRDSLALFTLIFLVALVFIKSLFPYTFTSLQLLAGKLYLRRRPNLIIFNTLRLAFARGILHPKLY